MSFLSPIEAHQRLHCALSAATEAPFQAPGAWLCSSSQEARRRQMQDGYNGTNPSVSL